MGIHVSAAPGFDGWSRLPSKNRWWKTLVKSEIEQLKRALIEDMENCSLCEGARAGGPSHAAFTWYTDKSAHSHQCSSKGRWFNPETRKMEGRAHCSCGSCFD